ncbi:MAG: histidine phosphatase family protein [Anaerolineales bacterium]|nr:histidine phosphatase family protein [Anaerolineales bacterium]
MCLYFVRHGESEANTQHVISNRAGPFGLTERGREQALILAEKLLEIPFTAIYSSPVLRARETADILSGSLGRAYQVTEALREYDCGVLEDRSDEESWKQHRKYYEDWILRHDFLSRPEGGESFVDIQNRFLPFIEALKNEDEGHILLIGHGGIFHLMLPLILTDIDNDFVRSHGIGHTECIVAELHSDGFICRQWGAVRF